MNTVPAFKAIKCHERYVQSVVVVVDVVKTAQRVGALV